MKDAGWLKDHFDRFAPSYDRVNHVLSLGQDVRWRARLIGSIDRQPALRVLDLCAGTLACTREVLRRFPDSLVTALDFSRSMLDSGLNKLTDPERSRLETVCTDVLNAKFAPGSFDIVISSFGVRHLPEQREVLSRVYDWLSPGGRFIIFDFFRPAAAVAMIFQATAGKHLLPWAGERLNGFGPAYLNLHQSIMRFLSRAEYEALLRVEGFEILRSENLTFGIVSLIISERAS